MSESALGRPDRSHKHWRPSDELVAHVQSLAAGVRGCIEARVTVRLADFGGDSGDVVEASAARLSADGMDCDVWPGREVARGCYGGVCFKATVGMGGQQIEVGDGGFVDWTKRLLGNHKERLMTSGLSLERMAMLVDEEGVLPPGVRQD